MSAFVFLLVCTQCSQKEPEIPTAVIDKTSNKLPAGKGALKVLAIGNSFLEDPLEYLGTIVSRSGINRGDICIYAAIENSTSLEYWAMTCKNQSEVTIVRYAGTMAMPTTKAPLIELLNQDWDVVTVQQLSNFAQDANKLQPDLSYLVSQIREHCPNKDVVIAWQQVWSYWGGSLQQSIDSWQNISDVAKLTLDYDVDMIIPTGTAIQNARETTLNTPHGLLRDEKHLAFGVGRYVAACTWFEAIISPVFGVSVVGNPAIHAITESEQSRSIYETAPVTLENRILCQQCAAAAVANPSQITIIE